MVYYKALRPNGTDFATGVTRPILGEWMPRIDNPVICARGYHLSDTPAETLIGGSWPCLLYEAEADGEPVAGFNEEHPHKGVFTSYRIIKELPAWQALGPNGEEAAALIERANSFTLQQLAQLFAAVRGSAARSVARSVAQNAAWSVAQNAAWSAARSAAWAAAGSAARFAAQNAISALVVRDLLTKEQFDILYGPWASVMEV